MKGSNWLGNKGITHCMCREATNAALELEDIGLPISRAEAYQYEWLVTNDLCFYLICFFCYDDVRGLYEWSELSLNSALYFLNHE